MRVTHLLCLIAALLFTGCGPIATGILVAIETSSGNSSGGNSSGGPSGPPPPAPSDTPLESVQLLVSTQEDAPLTFGVPNTSPDGAKLVYQLVDSPDHGAISGQPPELTYTPEPDWSGRERVLYQIQAGNRTAQAEILIDVVSVNDPPTAAHLAFELAENSSIPIVLQGNDVDGDSLSFELTEGPFAGFLSGSGGNRVYTPSPDAIGNDSLTYRVKDPDGAIGVGSVTFTVRPQLQILGVTPDRGDLRGGTRVRVTGKRFTTSTQVTIAGQPATAVALIDSGTIECDAPGGPLGYAAVGLTAPSSYPASDAQAYFYEGWEDPRSNLIHVPGGTTDADLPSLVAIPTGMLACAWSDQRTGTYQVRFATSSDQGQTWSPTIVIEPADVGFWSNPHLSVSPAGVLACVWRVNREALSCSRSLDGGLTWSTPVRIDDQTSEKDDPTVAVEASGAITCVWSDRRSADYRIMLSRSVDGGATWSPDTNLNANPNTLDQLSPYLTIASTGLVCVYSERERTGPTTVVGRLICARSSDGGVNWSLSRVDDDPDLTPTHKRYAHVLESNLGSLVSVWYSERNDSLRIARSADGGLTWSASAVLVQNARYFYPTLAWDHAGTLVCCWQHSNDIFSARSLDGGATWASPLRVDDDPSTSQQHYPGIVAHPGGPFISTWSDDRRSNRDVLCASSQDGTSWSASRRIDDDQVETRVQRGARAAFEVDGSIVVAWEDLRHANSTIYLSRSRDGGRVWSPNQLLGLNDGEAVEFHPSVVVDDTGAWVLAWTRRVGGRHRIVLRRSTDRGNTWSNVVVVNPATLNGEHPQLRVLPGGGLICAWTDRTTPRSLRYARSADGGLTWSAEQSVPHAEWVSDYSFDVGPGEWVFTWVNTNPSNPLGNPIMVVGRTANFGGIWTISARTPGSGSDAPRRVSVARAPGGVYTSTWLDADDGIYWIRSDPVGQLWTNAALIEAGTNKGDLGVAAGPGGSLIAAWDAPDSPNQTSVHVVRSTNGAVSWNPTVTGLVYPLPPTPGFNSTLFEDVKVGPNGQIVVLGRDPQPPMDPVFIRGWFRP